MSLARLMQADLEALKDESLDHIARRMDDIRRRLDLGRAGPKVREVEDGVIASLDKLIEEMEKQQQAPRPRPRRPVGRGSMRSTQPAARQRADAAAKGPGEVDEETDRRRERLGRPAARTSARRRCSRSARTFRPTIAT